MYPEGMYCDTFWASHGCGLPPGHEMPHVCDPEDPEGPCSVHDGTHVRYYLQGGARAGELSEPMESETYTA